MIKRISNFLWMLILGLFVVFYSNDSFARENINNTQESMNLFKTANGKVTRTLTNIGNWGYWYQHDGVSAHDPFTGGSGGYYPRGTAGAIYRDGLVWGGIVQDPDTAKAQLRVGGNTYRSGTQPGWFGADPDDEAARMYRIRLDWATLSRSAVIQDAAEHNNVSAANVTDAMCDEIINQYKDDWKNWPVDLGAPYYDVDDDGQYDPMLDEDGMPMIPEFDDDGNVKLDDNGVLTGNDYPGLAQADQIVWFVINDENVSRVNDLSGSSPIGLEIQTTSWAYNQPTTGLGQIVFKKYKIINKSGFKIDSMYVCQWCDPDLGDYGNDLSGCDIDLSMMFAYNGAPIDNQYAAFGMAPAAVGYDFFQGPMVASPGDTAVFDLKKVADHKNLPMTSYGYFGSGTRWTDPDMGDYDGTLQWYNLLRGYAPTTDIENPTWFLTTCGPNEGQPTKFPLSGDPVNDPAGLLGDVDGNTYQPGDRRMLQSTGPFVMEPDDIQEVVVAVVGGLGGDQLQSVADMKSTDDVAQTVYNSLFTVVPKPPESPQVNAIPQVDRVTLDWGWNYDAIAKTEEPIIINYEFEGYNVYQLASPTSKLTDNSTVRLATYDLINDVRIIKSSMFSAEYGTVVELPVQWGTDSGLKRYFVAEKDYINNLPLYRGSTYYFAVTAYNYDGNLIRDRALESAGIIYAVTIQDPNPGEHYGSEGGEDHTDNVDHSSGVAEAEVQITVVDPEKITGDDYQVFFNQQHYYMDVDGKWKFTNYPDSVGSGLSKPGDLTGTSLSAIAYTSPNVGTRDLRFILDLVAVDYDWSDGVLLQFPSEIVINSAEAAVGNGDGHSYNPTIDFEANTVLWGSNDTSEAGPFAGNEVFTVNVGTPTLPLDVDFVVFDDGWAVGYGAPYDTLGDGVVHAIGTCTITEEGYAFKTENHWNLMNTTIGDTVLEDQVDLQNVTPSSGPIADGFQIAVIGSYSSPVDYSTITLTDTLGVESNVRKSTDYITSYYQHNWAATARAIDCYGRGTTDMNELIKDYEITFTGEFYDSTWISGADTIVLKLVKEGTGSWAVLDGARGYDIANHPLNPNPGSSDPFMVRVPMEIRNVDDDRQINFVIYDRWQSVPTDTMWAFNPNGRMYTYFMNTPYKETLPEDAEYDQMTWNLVWWTANYAKGEKLFVKYANPIQLGQDIFSFSTAGMEATYSSDQEKADVKKINVFPNPYYGCNPQETSRFDRFVTFNHLPQKATFRIFNLAGVQVRKLEKNNDSQFFRWDLQNERGLPVASGIYIVHIDMPELGKEKVLKLCMVIAQQILEYY